MRLVACPSCKTHLDVTGIEGTSVVCPCGVTVDVALPDAVEGSVRRCGGCGAALEERAEECSYCHSPVVREPRRLSMVCPECLARNLEAAKFCTSCGVEFLPQEPIAPGEPRPCPACEETLVSQRVRDVWLLACSWCDGLWVPARSFDMLVRRVVADSGSASASLGRPKRRRPKLSAEVVYRRCVVCRQRMVRKNYGRTSGVIVDWCGAHGTWFDADELDAVATFAAGGGIWAEVPSPTGADEARIVLSAAEAKSESP